MSREEWRPIPSLPGWYASDLGRVKKAPTPVKMPNGGIKLVSVEPTFGHADKTGRRRIMANGKTRWVAAMVCEAFHGPRPAPRIECMHLDEDCSNNREGNLAWGTRSENQKAPKVTAMRRETYKPFNPGKLSDDAIEVILSSQGKVGPKELSERYGISRSYVHYLRAGKGRR